MEKQLANAVDELKAMRQELQGLQEQNHPLKAALQKSVKALEANVATLRERLAELKGAVIEGCKNTLAAVKERGIGALDSAARFFHVKPGLESLRNTINDGIKADEKAISRIEAVSAEYHEAGRHLKNIVRAVQGREALHDPKGPGALARGLSLPFRQDRRLMCAMQSRTAGVLKRLEHLEQAARPPIRQTMEECAKLAKAQESKERAAPAVSREAR